MRIIRKEWFSAGFACLLLLGLALGWVGSGISSAQTSPTGDQWQKIPDVPTNVDFRDVFMSGGSGIAVGQEGDHGAAYDLQWTALDGWRNSLAVSRVGFNFRAPLWAAVMVNEEEWAVGEQGLIAHKQNGGWSEVAGPVPDAKLVTLQMLGNGDEGWAGGFRMVSGAEKPEPVLLHYVSGLWQRDEFITGEGTINALHFAQGGGWAVGDAGIWRYYRGAWSKEQEPNPCPETGCFQTV